MGLDKPALVMNDLKSGVQKGQAALAVLTGATCFSNFEIRTTPDAAWERREPPMPPGTLSQWSLSPSYDALERNPERALSPAESAAIRWQDVQAEAPGFVVINRFRESPHPRVSFANDFFQAPTNELLLAVSELGGGWGFICRLADLEN